MPALENDLIRGSVARKLLRYALPLVASSLLQAAYSITDIIVAGHFIGDVGITAINNGSVVMNMLTQVAIGRRDRLRIFGNDYPTPDGTCIRDYIHVMDLAQGHVAAVRYTMDNTGTEVFNLGTGRGSSVLEMVNAFMSATGVDIPYEIVGRRPGDIAVCYADPGKSQRVLGWTAQRTLTDMCRDSWNWQQKNPMGFGR